MNTYLLTSGSEDYFRIDGIGISDREISNSEFKDYLNYPESIEHIPDYCKDKGYGFIRTSTMFGNRYYPRIIVHDKDGHEITWNNDDYRNWVYQKLGITMIEFFDLHSD